MKTIKSGYYINYENKEYRVARKQDATYSLISHDSNDLASGFKDITDADDKKPIYIKKIDPSEISEVYSYSTYWLYKGQYRVMTYSDEEWFNDQPTCRIIANDYALAQKEGFETFMGQGEYIGTVKKSDLELIEVKKLANDFVR